MNEEKKECPEWLTWVLLVLFPLIGIIVVWTSKRSWSKNKKIVVTVICVFWLIISLSMVGGNKKTATTANSGIATTATVADQGATAAAATTVKETTAKATTAAAVPTEYKSALEKAKLYSKTMHLSYQKLYEQLTSEYGEKFSAEAAQYAVDNVAADWDANALEKAKEYQKMSMSTSAIYDQLISSYGEEFTAEQAQYAIDHLN